MKQNVKFDNPKINIQVLPFAVSLICFLGILTSCRIPVGDRTTVIYGKVTDQNQEPVDSILVLVSGARNFLNSEDIKQVYTDRFGHYEMVLEVPRKYGNLNVTIPYFPVENSKFQDNYMLDIALKNGKNNCCHAAIGEKTEINFQLKPKK